MMASHNRPFTAKPRTVRISQTISKVMMSPIPRSLRPGAAVEHDRRLSPSTKTTSPMPSGRGRGCPVRVASKTSGGAAAEPLVHIQNFRGIVLGAAGFVLGAAALGLVLAGRRTRTAAK
jgi:hypothetical protein